MSRHQKSNSCRKGKKRGSHQSLIPDSLQNHSMREPPNVHKVTTFQLEEQLLKTITCLRLPFQTVENPVFQRLLNLVNSGTGVLELPSAKTLRRRLRNAVTIQQESQLQDLPEDAKVSLALDCWTSPFQQAFMAITVYFIDKDWNYREMLLGFEPLHGPHTGNNLSDVLHQSLKERGLLDRIFSVTTDNASNNETLIRALQEKLISTGVIGSRESIVRVPCMAHVIQLCLKQLLGHIRAENKEVKTIWSDTQVIGLRDSASHGDVAHALAKVSPELPRMTVNMDGVLTKADSVICGVCQCKPTTARYIFMSSIRRYPAVSLARCSNALELHVFDASPRASTKKYLR